MSKFVFSKWFLVIKSFMQIKSSMKAKMQKAPIRKKRGKRYSPSLKTKRP
jgi:hypothetical protein